MSYIKNRIAQNLETDPLYRAAYNEEVELIKQAKARREAVMKRLLAARKANHLTQEQLAAKLRLSQERVSQLESGEETISVDRLLEIAAVLGLRMMLVNEEEVLKRGLQKDVVC